MRILVSLFVSLLIFQVVFGQTREDWLNQADFLNPIQVTINVTQTSTYGFQVSPSSLEFDSGSAYQLTIVAKVGTNDSFVWRSSLFDAIALRCVTTKEAVYYAPKLTGIGTTSAQYTEKSVVVEFVPVIGGEYDLVGTIPGFEAETTTILPVTIKASGKETLVVEEMVNYPSSILNDPRRNSSSYVWKTATSIETNVEENPLFPTSYKYQFYPTNFSLIILEPYIFTVNKIAGLNPHAVASDLLFPYSLWRMAQDTNAQVYFPYLQEVLLPKIEGSLDNSSVSLYLIPLVNGLGFLLLLF